MQSRYLLSYVHLLRAGSLALASPLILGLGYFVSACLLLAALHKPFAPGKVGLWHFGDEFSLHLGFGSAAATGTELLGWWLIPAGMLLGGAGVLSMNRLAASVFRGAPSAWLRLHWIGCIEVALVGGLLIADRMHLVPFSNTPFLLALGWLSLRMRHLRWRHVGLVRPDSWMRTILAGIVAGLALECLSLLATEPLIAWATGVAPDRSDMRPVVGSAMMLGVAMALNWTLAAFGEEFAWRGYLLNRISDLGVGRALPLLLTSTLFGIAHGESQGLGGMLQEGFAGFALGVLYFASGNKLAVPVIAHGASNSLALVMIYFNRYPGL